jgi:hypothetical protein
MLKTDRMTRPGSGYKFGVSATHSDTLALANKAEGTFIFDMRDAKTGERLHYFERKNVITLDAGIHAARLFKDPTEPTNGINMLAVGTGATGALLSPDAPDPRQRKLNAEIARKAFSSTTFRDAGGNAVAIPTNVVDFTTTYGEAEAVGPLNEMGVISTISDNPLVLNPSPDTFPTRTLTLDISLYDVQVNYLSFAVVTKPSTAILTITWRLTF